jgi:sugar phosphate isomerase/epimerase
MSRALSLAYLTFAPFGPEEALSLAADIGCGHVGLRIAPAMAGGDFAPLIADKALLRRVKQRMADTGVTVFDVEIIRLTEDFRVEEVRGFLDTCGELGARAVLVAGIDEDDARLTANYAAFAEAAAPYGLTADLEFMPWTAVKDCRTALRVVEASGAPNGRVLVDALHFARSSSTLYDIWGMPSERISYVQICDAPPEVPTTLEGMLHTARQERLLPGDGGIELLDIVAGLPADTPVSIEIPNVVRKAELGVAAWARLAVERTRDVLAHLPLAPPGLS